MNMKKIKQDLLDTTKAVLKENLQMSYVYIRKEERY